MIGNIIPIHVASYTSPNRHNDFHFCSVMTIVEMCCRFTYYSSYIVCTPY